VDGQVVEGAAWGGLAVALHLFPLPFFVTRSSSYKLARESSVGGRDHAELADGTGVAPQQQPWVNARRMKAVKAR
jgi:hypothetical protein